MISLFSLQSYMFIISPVHNRCSVGDRTHGSMRSHLCDLNEHTLVGPCGGTPGHIFWQELKERNPHIYPSKGHAHRIK